VCAYFCAVEIVTLYREIATGAKRPRNDTVTLGRRINQTKAINGSLRGGASRMPRPTPSKEQLDKLKFKTMLF